MSKVNLDCITATQRMHEFLDNELESTMRAAMERHLGGCADCSTTLAQLRRLENAHHQLDGQLKPPPEAYWQVLPQKVMERVRASERRRLLALPRLPRFKSPVERVPTANKLPTSNMLNLPPAVRSFLNGTLKYALPLAAAAAFCFFMIRELRRDDGLVEKSTMQASDSTLQSSAAAKKTDREAREGVASVAQPVNLEEQPTALRNAPTKTQYLPASPLAISKEHLEIKFDSLAVAAKLESVAAGGSGAMAPHHSAGAAASFGQRQESTSPGSVASFQPALPRDSIKITPPTQLLAKAEDQLADTGASRLAQGDVAGEFRPAAEMPERDDKAQEPQALRAPARASESRASALKMNRTAGESDASKFSQVLQQAQQTADLKQREKIWRDFLATEPDSSSRGLAIFHLAETLAAASDSTSKLDQLEKNIAYFRDNAAVIRPRMGEKEFDREVARLQTLLAWRKSSQKP